MRLELFSKVLAVDSEKFCDLAAVDVKARQEVLQDAALVRFRHICQGPCELSLATDGGTVATHAAALVWEIIRGACQSQQVVEQALHAQQGKWFMVIGDKKSEKFDWVGDPVFSPDGKKVAFGARKGRKLWWKVLDVE